MSSLPVADYSDLYKIVHLYSENNDFTASTLPVVETQYGSSNTSRAKETLGDPSIHRNPPNSGCAENLSNPCHLQTLFTNNTKFVYGLLLNRCLLAAQRVLPSAELPPVTNMKDPVVLQFITKTYYSYHSWAPLMGGQAPIPPAALHINSQPSRSKEVEINKDQVARVASVGIGAILMVLATSFFRKEYEEYEGSDCELMLLDRSITLYKENLNAPQSPMSQVVNEIKDLAKGILEREKIRHKRNLIVLGCMAIAAGVLFAGGILASGALMAGGAVLTATSGVAMLAQYRTGYTKRDKVIAQDILSIVENWKKPKIRKEEEVKAN